MMHDRQRVVTEQVSEPRQALIDAAIGIAPAIRRRLLVVADWYVLRRSGIGCPFSHADTLYNSQHCSLNTFLSPHLR